MSDKTVQYKRTIRGSVGAGVGSLFNGNGRRYYVLEHKNASKFHKAGEAQKIIIDEIEMGREASCQVRFDDTFSTVSRRHAAIVRDGDKWKLVQLSKTNSTFLNGKKIETEWYLENGDEIQLSVGGPCLGFIVPAGKQSLVSSIKMTERLNLFRKQALRPYKTALVCLFLLLVVACAGGGYIIRQQSMSIKDLLSKVDMQHKMFDDVQEKYRKDSIEWANKIKKGGGRTVTRTVVVNPDATITKEIEAVKSSVFAVITSTYAVDVDGNTKKICSSQGTGFLTTDGRFVTARHCVEPWMFDKDMNFIYAASLMGAMDIYSVVYAVNNNNEELTIKSENFRIDRTYDCTTTASTDMGDGENLELPSKMAFGNEASLGNDWAYCKVNKKGKILDGRSFSSNMKSGTTAHLLGFPRGIGLADGKKLVEPIYNKLTISRTGLNNGRCIMVNQGVEHGNSGGPVFVENGGKLYVIGIVSRGDGKTDIYNHIVPMCNLN